MKETASSAAPHPAQLRRLRWGAEGLAEPAPSSTPIPTGRRPLAVDSVILDTPTRTAVAHHKTTRWTSDPNLTDIEVASTPRRLARTARTASTVPWIHLTVALTVLATLITLVLCQKAQLMSAQYTLVDLKAARARELKLRDELKLNIQRLSSLDRVDSLSRAELRMSEPPVRQVLDLQRTARHDDPNQTLAAANGRHRRADPGAARL